MKPVVVVFFMTFSAVTVAQTHQELAGKPFSGYPFFHCIHSFNFDEPIYAAIDIQFYPELAGITANLYVVVDKSTPEWESEPLLMDITSDGAITVSLDGNSMVENTFQLAAALELNSLPDPGTRFGIGYDLVVDIDNDGMLSPADLIDGLDDAGFYVVHDITGNGPHAVSTQDWTTEETLTKRVWYPSGIEDMDPLPLVMISHGWTHNYTYYDYLGEHIASYGYIVVSHWNDVGDGNPAGTNSASLSLLANIDHLLEGQATLFDGVLDGRIDHHHMTWLGHSTGGETPVRAYTRLREGTNESAHFTWEDVKLISSICPVSWFSYTYVNPYDINYHQFIGGADTDVSGFPYNDYTQPMTIYERATGNRQLTYIHGAGHGVFHNDEDAEEWASGPDLLTREQVHPVVKSYFLALLELYVHGNPAAKDFFTRNYAEFHPSSLDSAVVISNEYRDGHFAVRRVIDDFQANTSATISSSGGGVESTVAVLSEILMADTDESLAYTSLQPANGMTRARFDDDPRCVVFEWQDDSEVSFHLLPQDADLSEFEFLSFRACQRTRHPFNVEWAGPITFSVGLVDSGTDTSFIDITGYGPVAFTYQRGGGWQNEFNTTRIRLDDFLTDGREIDLENIASIIFRFGPSHGSSTGALGLDDIELVNGDVQVLARVDHDAVPSQSMTCYPNPGSSMLNIEMGDLGVMDEIRISDLHGRTVLKSGRSFTVRACMDISSLPDGLYVVYVWSGKRMYCRTLVVMH